MGRPLQLQSAVQHSDSQTRPAVPDSGHQMPGPALSQCGRHRQPRLPECGRGQQFQAVAKGCQQGSLQRAPVSSTASCSHSGRCQQFHTVAPSSSRQLHASCSHSGSSLQSMTEAPPMSASSRQLLGAPRSPPSNMVAPSQLSARCSQPGPVSPWWGGGRKEINTKPCLYDTDTAAVWTGSFRLRHTLASHLSESLHNQHTFITL